MPSNLYRRGSVWYARIQVAGKDIRQSLQTTDRRAAERELKVRLADLSTYHGASERTFDSIMADFLLDAETRLKPKTVKRYASSMLMLTDVFGGWPFHSITKQAVVAYVDRRKSEGTSIPTIKRDLTVLSQAAEWAMERGEAGTNPVALLSKRSLRHKRAVFRRPTPQSEAATIGAAYGNLKALAHFLRATGMRLDEGVHLTWHDVDAPRSVAMLPDTKNGRLRTIDLSQEALAVLKGQPRRSDTGLVFPAIDRLTGKAAPYKQASTNWQEAKARAKATAAKEGRSYTPLSLHALRHLYAIDYLAAGGDLYMLQQQLGHGSIRQTEEYLQHLSPAEARRAKHGPSQIPAHPRRFTVVEGGENVG